MLFSTQPSHSQQIAILIIFNPLKSNQQHLKTSLTVKPMTTKIPDPALQLATFQKYYNALNPEQQAAVDAIEGPVMTIAGAGTGKTQILAVRIAKILLETQIDPYNILCLTFTDSGVAAMRKRLIEIIGPTAYHIKVCTFHSFCNEVIKDNPEEFLFKRDFTQIDDLEKIQLLQHIIDELGVRSPIRPHGDPYFYQFDLESRIKDLKKENLSPETFTIKIHEIGEFLNKLAPLFSNFLEIKGAPPEEEINKFSPELIFPQIKIDTPTKIQLSYLNYYQHLWTNYQNALTGQKRQDSTKRTAFKNALKDFIQGSQKDLPKQQELAKAYSLYQAKLSERARYDYEDMILLVSQRFALDNLQTHGGLLRKYQETYQYILVDEYQDTNSAQNQTVDLLGNYFTSPNIFVVGDDDQSIYRFQGASIENIIDFHKRYAEEVKLVTLISNYRSQQTVLDAASAVVSHNQNRIANYLPAIDKNLQSARDLTVSPLELSIYETENSENFGIATTIQKLIAEGTSPQEIAVLFRSHHNAEDLIELMFKLQIPFELKAGSDILKNLDINKLIQLFRTIESPNDNEKLVQTLFLDFLQINKQDILKLSHYFFVNRLEKAGYNIYQILSLPEHLKQARIEVPLRLQKFASLLAEWKDNSLNLTLSEFFDKVIKKSLYLEYLMKKSNRLEQLNRLNTLFKEIKNLTKKNHAVTITEFLDQLRLRAENRLKLNEEPLQTNKNAVQLMTAHASKGLEFEHVFLLKCTNKNWGKTTNKDKIKLPKGLIKSEIIDEKLQAEEDERRLFYVALTRAKLMVHLSYARFRSEQNKQKEDISTIFLSEIPPEHLTSIDTTDIENRSLEQLETIFFTPPEPDFNEQEKAFIQKLAQDHIISPTSLNNYLACPRKFMYQNLVRIPQAKNKSSAMGSAIHASLDFYFKQYKKSRIKPDKSLLTLRYKYYLEKELLTEKDYKERLQIGQNILNDYYDQYADSFNPDTRTEYNFSQHGVNIDGIPLTGKIDKITADTTNPHNLTVTDFKTGNCDSALQKTRHGQDYWRQVIFYKILCDHSPIFKRDFQNASMQSGVLEFLEPSKATKKYLITPIELTTDSVNEVIENIRFAHKQINALNFEKIDQCEDCERCPFFNLCWKK